MTKFDPPPTSALHNLHPEYSNWTLIGVVHLPRFKRRILLPQSIIKYGQSRISLVPEIEFHVSEPGLNMIRVLCEFDDL